MAFSVRQNVWDDDQTLEAWTAWRNKYRHRAHADRPDRDSGVRRHHQPFMRLTGCPRRQFPLSEKWLKNGRPTARQDRYAARRALI